MEEENSSLMPDQHSELRRLAEEMLLKQPGAMDKIQPDNVQSIVHELRVHEIELEMQNDELRRTQQELAAAHYKMSQ